MRAFITGGQGFVGTWLSAHLAEQGDQVVVAGVEVDITDPSVIGPAIREADPDAVYHLAALTHVGESWNDPAETVRVNTLGTQHVLDAARSCPTPPRVLLVSSAEVYGAVSPDELPLTEASPLRPATPYAASKVAAEYLGVQAHLGFGVPVIRVRAFNHVGPGQAPTFAVSGLARRVVEAERSGASSITAGNLAARRDITDVRDVVRAYRLLVERGVPGAAYNVCSGVDVAISEVAEMLLELSGSDLQISVDPALIRPLDLPVLRGDPSLLVRDTGWHPEWKLDQTLAACLDHWRAEPSG